jgi:hypothetical protein
MIRGAGISISKLRGGENRYSRFAAHVEPGAGVLQGYFAIACKNRRFFVDKLWFFVWLTWTKKRF